VEFELLSTPKATGGPYDLLVLYEGGLDYRHPVLHRTIFQLSKRAAYVILANSEPRQKLYEVLSTSMPHFSVLRTIQSFQSEERGGVLNPSNKVTVHRATLFGSGGTVSRLFNPFVVGTSGYLLHESLCFLGGVLRRTKFTVHNLLAVVGAMGVTVSEDDAEVALLLYKSEWNNVLRVSWPQIEISEPLWRTI
jgi:hypothetical protein